MPPPHFQQIAPPLQAVHDDVKNCALLQTHCRHRKGGNIISTRFSESEKYDVICWVGGRGEGWPNITIGPSKYYVIQK